MESPHLAIGKPPLTDEMLSQIGLATIYEARAKTLLSVTLKAIAGHTFNEWVDWEKRQFSQIVDALEPLIDRASTLGEHFEIIRLRHAELRESRNFVVHAIWAQSANGGARTYCYRRKKLGDENDIVRAANDSFWLATKAHELACQVALKIEAGEIPEGVDEAGFSMRAQNRSVKF